MPKPGKQSEPIDRSRATIHALILVSIISATVIIFRISRIYVDRDLAAQSRPPRIVLVNRPPWMSDTLAEQIIGAAQPAGLHSTFDRGLLIDTDHRLLLSPWVKDVRQVRRAYGETPGDTIEVDCEFRAPAALVKWGQVFCLVDGQGTRLPEQYSASQLSRIIFTPDHKVNLRVITGVAHTPPDAGKPWQGQDLAGGLELARLLSGRDWAEEIRQIDVSNAMGRKDSRGAQIVLITQYNTQIRWGRPPSAPDGFVEIPVATKLQRLQELEQQKHRIDAGQPWLDIRFDHITAPVQASAAQ